VQDRDLLVQRALAHERAEPAAPCQEAVGDHAEDRLPNGRERDAEERGELALRRQLLARLELATLDQVEQQLLDLSVQRKLRASPDGGRAGERRPALERRLGRGRLGLPEPIDSDIMRS
jgi:hypothetical protein